MCSCVVLQSWLSGGPANVCIAAQIDPAVVNSHINFLKDCISQHLEGPREHLASFGKFNRSCYQIVDISRYQLKFEYFAPILLIL